jgi:glycosyltransferase involved in cell wall biosynthesis
LPFVLTPVHHPRWRGYPYREYDKIYREADAILALTTAERDTLVSEKGVVEEKVHVTGIGPVLSERYSADDFRLRFGLKERFVLFVGQQYKYKGVDAILQAAPIVWEKHPDVRFVFIGPRMPESRSLFRTFRDSRLLNLGAVDLETKTSALAACEFLCMPSAQESFGGVYVEAWSLRKAVIGGRIGPIACVIDEGRDGLLSSQDAPELAEAISYLLSHPSDCRAMGDCGWQKVQEKYTWDRLAKKTLDVYREFSP